MKINAIPMNISATKRVAKEAKYSFVDMDAIFVVTLFPDLKNAAANESNIPPDNIELCNS